jgi:carbon-monoxide dehydrogenase large subunit
VGAKFFGREQARLEDPAFLTGRGRYLEDLQLPGLLSVAFLRSQDAHAEFELDLSQALKQPGVVAIVTAMDLEPVPTVPTMIPHDALRPCNQPALASTVARYVGEPLAAVLAESRYQAEDALHEILVETRPLEPVVTVDQALAADAPTLIAGCSGNVAGAFGQRVGDVDGAFRDADVVMEGTFDSHRYSGQPLEPRGVMATFDHGSGVLTVWSSTQWPHTLKEALTRVLPLAEHRIRVVAPDVGGGFGVKQEVYPEELVLALLALRRRRPLKWVETRSEHFTSANHAREQRHRVRIAARADGTILGMRVEITSDMGAYVRSLGLLCPSLTAAELPGPYRVPNYEAQVRCVLTNKSPAGAYRGAGLPEAIFATERAMDRLARRIGLDPAELRRRNFVPPDEFPYDTGLDASQLRFVYDSGSYGAGLDRALELSGYRDWRRRQEQGRAEGRLIGVGLAAFVMLGGLGPHESARLRVDATGDVVLVTGASPHGQGTATALAQIVADELGVTPEQVTVRHGDTDLVPFGVGTYASRNAVVAGGAAYEAAVAVRTKALAVAAQALETEPEDLEVVAGGIAVAGAPRRFLPWDQLARMAEPGNRLPHGVEPVLEATRYFDAPLATFSSGVHVAVVEVDPRSGELRILDYTAVTDAGRVINPMIARGQLLGGLAQGIGGTVSEELRYGADGQLLTGSFMDYLVPRAPDMPAPKIAFVETPSPRNPLGVKGLGESGTVGVPAALCNALEDALQPLGVQVGATPLTPDRIWEWMRQSRRPPEQPGQPDRPEKGDGT